MASKRPTHQDIAQLAGTSQATVSLVLNNRASALRISDKTRDAVLEAARQLGYVPDLNARRLRHALGASAAPELVLAVLRPAGTPLGIAVYVIEAAQKSLARLFAGASRSQLVLEEFEPGKLAEHPGLIAGSRFHGAILTSLTPEDERFLEEAELQVPLVAYQRQMTHRSFVDVDNVQGGRAATEHLLARGRRRIAALSYVFPPSCAQFDRLTGYRQALAEAGLPETEHTLLASELDAAAGAEATRRVLLESKPDAIFALSDVLALGAMRGMRQAGLRIPEDVAVVGYDDLSYAPFLDPPLSSVRLPYEAMAQAAVEWLATAVPGQATGPLKRIFQPELVVRDSS